MKNNIIEDIKEYAKDSQTKQEPSEQNYAEGVKVGWTLPAKWWNWLMNAFTKRFRETKATVDSMYEELSNLMWPLVPGENETNDQCSHRIYGRMSELSEQIDTNATNVEKNATAINTEKLARQAAIEQEQTARTQQDNVLDSKINSLSDTVEKNATHMRNELVNKLGNPYFLDNINDNATYTFNSITLIDTSSLIDIHNPSGVTTFSIHLYGALKYLAIKFLDTSSSFDVLTLSSYGELVEFNMKESASSPYIYRYLLLIPFYDK